MDPDIPDTSPSTSIAKLPVAAAVVALVGIADSIYLTVHHYTAEPVPCSIIEGCEQVLNSQWAEIGGIPLAAFGAAAYFAAFSLALLTAFGDGRMWKLFGVQVAIMAVTSAYLVYVQGALIGAFCQFCLLSALTSFVLLTLFVISIFSTRKEAGSMA
ncbi:MAG: vitamin K epoxide reductase family protein [Acidobacteria bacterium]|nr:vitamin K epoxide reductase family protein [Acidobacteriota bacterium]